MTAIPSYFFREAVRGAALKGADIEQILLAAGVDPALLDDPCEYGSAESMARLVQQVWYTLDDEFMGFTRLQAKVGLFGLMTRFLVPCESLEQVLLAGARFYNLVRSDIHMSLTTVNGDAIFEARFAEPALDPNHYFQEFWLVIWHRLAGWLTGGALPLRRAEFSFAGPRCAPADFHHMFPCEHLFDQETNRFAFDAVNLRLPVVRTSAELKALLKEAPLIFLLMPSHEAGLARKVRAALLPKRDEPVDFENLDDIALKLHITPQTMRRRLKREGTSFGAIKEDIRRDIAIQKVLKGGARIEDIAHAVGYTEARSFTRAFHQWTGLSPVKYREKYYEPLSQQPRPVVLQGTALLPTSAFQQSGKQGCGKRPGG